jgi:tetratricopeptide (TPR) repeat protein
MRRLLVLGSLLCAVTLATGSSASAQTENTARDASRHFQRAVDLYNEGDFRGALVEFKKAHTLLPRAPVLFNIGQTEYQLQEYAAALRTLERFLAETGPSAAHRAEVQETVEVLRGRVGWIAVTTDRANCDVMLDDVAAGVTPLSEPALVSIGRRRVAVSCGGQRLAGRDVDVPAGETVKVDLKVSSSSSALPSGSGSLPMAADSSSRTTRRGATVAWAITAVMAAATLGIYAGAVVESRQLDTLRNRYPITPEELDHKKTLTSRLALTGDILAAATVAVAGFSTYLSLSSRETRNPRIALAWGGLVVNGSF